MSMRNGTAGQDGNFFIRTSWLLFMEGTSLKTFYRKPLPPAPPPGIPYLSQSVEELNQWLKQHGFLTRVRIKSLSTREQLDGLDSLRSSQAALERRQSSSQSSAEELQEGGKPSPIMADKQQVSMSAGGLMKESLAAQARSCSLASIWKGHGRDSTSNSSGPSPPMSASRSSPAAVVGVFTICGPAGKRGRTGLP